MHRKDVTLIVIPHGKDYVREFHLSRRFLGIVAFVVILLSASSLFCGTGYYIQLRKQSGIEKSEVLNRQLCEQLQTLRDKARVLKDKMNELGQQSDALRVLAQLPEIDPDTRMVGVGGGLFEKEQERITPDLSSEGLLENTEEEIDRLLRQAVLEKASFEEIESKLLEDERFRSHTPSILPTNGYVCSPFGYRTDPLTGQETFHEGVDIAARLGTPVYASANGTVTCAEYSEGYGNAVMIDHGYEVKTLYAHLSTLCVRQGEEVIRGQKIGEVGGTGRTSGCHLHYEVRRSDRPVNPCYFFYIKEDIG
jgi:murein DD-endopeptidase MepM/ murein hydrolase activator NlpD